MLLASTSQSRLTYWKQGLVGYACACLLAENIGSLRECMDKFDVEILLVDFDLCMNSPASLRRYGAEYKVIVLHSDISEKTEWELLKAGVRGCCRVDVEHKLLNQVVETVRHGEMWFRRSLISRMVDELGKTTSKNKAYRASFGLLNKLTQREYDIAVCIQNGDSNKQIAKACGISEQTVKRHLTEIYSKLGVTDRLNLALALAADDKSAQNINVETIFIAKR